MNWKKLITLDNRFQADLLTDALGKAEISVSLALAFDVDFLSFPGLPDGQLIKKLNLTFRIKQVNYSTPC